MTPYQTVERLINKFGVRDTLIMISEVCYREAEESSDVVAGKWIKAGKVIQSSVRNLPNGPGIK